MTHVQAHLADHMPCRSCLKLGEAFRDNARLRRRDAAEAS